MLTGSQVLSFPSTWRNSSTEMAVTVSSGAKEAIRGLLGVREHRFPYSTLSNSSPMGLHRSMLFRTCETEEICVGLCDLEGGSGFGTGLCHCSHSSWASPPHIPPSLNPVPLPSPAPPLSKTFQQIGSNTCQWLLPH